MRVSFREILLTQIRPDKLRDTKLFLFLMMMLLILFFIANSHPTLAGSTTLPGEDMSSKMDSAGTLLRFIDTGIFKWAARVLAGLCIFGAAWSLKEGRYGPAIISVISAILFGTAPTWVKNIFTIGGSDSVFSSTETQRYIATFSPDQEKNFPETLASPFDGGQHA